MKEVVRKFRELQTAGIDSELLIIYIADKTKLSKRDVIAMLSAQEDFYTKLITNEVADRI